MNANQSNQSNHPHDGATPQMKIQSLTQAPSWESTIPENFVPEPVHLVTPSPVHVVVCDEDFITPPKQKNRFVTYWRRLGGGSLMLSLLIHVGIFLTAFFIVQTVVTERKVDFLPGGGSQKGDASAQLSQQVQQKKRSALNKPTPMRKVVSNSMNAAISLPDVPMDTIDMPEMSNMMGGMAGSAGFGNAGAGGGFGKGLGIGGMNGVTFKPVVMFGRDLKARKIAVILDVSGSMTPHLTKVIKELDRVAKGSPVVLYVGCGVATPPDGHRINDDTMKTISKSNDEDKSFELFWRHSHLPPNTPPDSPLKKLTKDGGGDIPEAPVYHIMANRPETFFIKSQGIQYAWVSLLVNDVQKVDALYWFSDFQDAVDDEQLEKVLKTLRRRKQTLFIHASVRGKSFEAIRDKLVLPLGGEVIETDTKK